MNHHIPTAMDEQAVHRRLMRFGEADSLATPMWDERATSVRAIAAYRASLWSPPTARARRRRAAHHREGAAARARNGPQPDRDRGGRRRRRSRRAYAHGARRAPPLARAGHRALAEW